MCIISNIQYVFLLVTFLIQNISGEGIFDDSLDIVGGEVVNHGDAPWNARLNIIQGAGNWFKSFICSGSLINERWILTDAHCSYIYPDPFNRLLNFGMDVQLGVYNLSMKETSEVIISSSEYPNKNYDNNKRLNDISLLKLNQSLDFKGKHSSLSPIKLNNNNYSVDETNCFAYGWGFIGDLANRTTVLQKVRLSILNDTVCQITHNKTNQFKYDPEKMLCAANDEHYKSVCRGDDGGPLLCPLKNNPSIWIQYGIASNNAGCDPDGGAPSLFTRVSHYIDWIEKTIRENSD